MSWRLIDDGFDTHPKVVELQKLPPGRFACAVALWTLAGCHAQRGDGTIPIEILRRIHITSPLRSAADLVAVSLWIRVDSETYRFHDWEDYNDSVEEKAAKRKVNRDRQRRWREARNVTRNALRDALVTPPYSNTNTNTPTSPQLPLESVSVQGLSENESIEAVFATWVELHISEPGRSRTLLSPDRRKRIKARLREGYTVERLQAALRGALADNWIMGIDPKSPRSYRGIENILRDGSQVERLEGLDGADPAVDRGVAPVGDFSDVDEEAELNRLFGDGS